MKNPDIIIIHIGTNNSSIKLKILYTKNWQMPKKCNYTSPELQKLCQFVTYRSNR